MLRRQCCPAQAVRCAVILCNSTHCVSVVVWHDAGCVVGDCWHSCKGSAGPVRVGEAVCVWHSVVCSTAHWCCERRGWPHPTAQLRVRLLRKVVTLLNVLLGGQ